LGINDLKSLKTRDKHGILVETLPFFYASLSHISKQLLTDF